MKKFILFLFISLTVLILKGQDQALISNVRKISATQGGFTGQLDEGDLFGSVEAIGDIDGDGIEDLAAGAYRDDDGDTNSGAVWIIFMNQDRTIKSVQKISSNVGGFSGILDAEDRFGRAITAMGDMDKDGTPDIAVGAQNDDDGGINSGAVWLLYLNSNGTVRSHQKISASEGGLTGLTANRGFGYSISSLGDLDGDGNFDIAVGSPTYDNDGGTYRGCVWILFLNQNGTVKLQKKINDFQGGFRYTLDNNDRFASSVENIGDIDKDGNVDLAVSSWDDDNVSNGGAIYILFLDSNGTVKHDQKISATNGDFQGQINEEDYFGFGLSYLGDIDGDNVNDLLASSPYSDEGGTNRGKVWVMCMKSDGTAKSYSEINNTTPSILGQLDDEDHFGWSLSVFSGVNKDGKKEIVVGAYDKDGATDAGAVYILDFDIVVPEPELVSNVRKISATQGGFTGQLDEGDMFCIVKSIGDVNNDGIEDMAIGAAYDDDGGTDCGAVWIIFMNSDGSVKNQQKINQQYGGFNQKIENGSFFGRALSSLGDFDNDGTPDIAVGAWGDYDDGNNSGAVWILMLNPDGTVKKHQKISASQGGLVGLTASRQFGYGVTSLGDLDGDGITDIAVGSPTYDNDGGLYRGCVWILFLNSDGTVKAQQKINDFQGGFTGVLRDKDRFGFSLENIGDINNDGIIEIAVQAHYDSDGGYKTGAIYILFLNTNGTVNKTQKISSLHGNFTGVINPDDLWGIGIANIGDTDGDGINDILASSYLSEACGENKGNVWVLHLERDGTVKEFEEINCSNASLSELIEDNDGFGFSVSSFNGFSESGKKEIIVGTINDDDGAANAGAVYILDLDVKHKPMAMAGNDITACASNTYEINGVNSSVPDNDPLSYSWVCPEAPELNNESISFSFVAPEVEMTQSYNIILTVSCQGIYSNPDTISIIVKPQPQVPTIEQFADTLLASKAFNYFWYYNGTQIAGENDSVLIISKTGEYQVKLNNEFGCMSEISPSYHIIFSSVNSLNNQIKFFPNPVTENFNISGFEGTALLTVTDLNGKIYLSKRILQHELINAGALPRGVYFAKFQKENIIVNEKFIKY